MDIPRNKSKGAQKLQVFASTKNSALHVKLSFLVFEGSLFGRLFAFCLVFFEIELCKILSPNPILGRVQAITLKKIWSRSDIGLAKAKEIAKTVPDLLLMGLQPTLVLEATGQCPCQIWLVGLLKCSAVELSISVLRL